MPRAPNSTFRPMPLGVWSSFSMTGWVFRRLPRGVALTEAGGRYLAGVSTLLDQLAEATGDLQRFENSRVLTVSAAPSLISRWLIPRLCRFTRHHPDFEVRIHVSPTFT